MHVSNHRNTSSCTSLYAFNNLSILSLKGERKREKKTSQSSFKMNLRKTESFCQQIKVLPSLKHPAKSFNGWKLQRNLEKSTKIFIIIGNYPAVRRALLNRQWVENTDESSHFFDLKWTRKARIPLGLRDWQLFNHLDRNFELTTKSNLTTRLSKLRNASDFFPLCHRARGGLGLEFIQTFKLTYAVSILKEFVYFHVDYSLEKIKTALMVANRWANWLEKGKEKFITANEWAMLSCKLAFRKIKEPREDIMSEAKDLLERLKEIDPQFYLNGHKNIWIVKPAFKSRGRGITIMDSIDSIEKYCDNYSSWVVQKYIENPLIISNRKFDIRLWALVNAAGPTKLYVYKDCYLRFSAEDWDISALKNKYIHLTNNSISKKSQTFDCDQSMWHLDTFKDYLEDNGVSWDVQVFPSIKKIIYWSFCSVKKLNTRKGHGFELFGLDFMLDEFFKPWLLEINSSPSMEYSTPVTAQLVQKVLTDCISTVVDGNPGDFICISRLN